MTTTNDLSRYSSNELAQELNRRNTKMGGIDVRPASVTASTNSNSPGRAIEHRIYGNDDRKDIYEVRDQAILDDANSVVAIMGVLQPNTSLSELPIDAQLKVVDLKDGTRIPLVAFNDFIKSKYGQSLCSDQPFQDQLVYARLSASSGFLVAPDIVATAAHCVYKEIDRSEGILGEQKDLQKLRFIFGFQMGNGSILPVSENLEVYEASHVIDRVYNTSIKGGKNIDWALVKLKKPVTNHPIVSVRHNGKIVNNQPVHVIGHPIGLPLKYAGNAKVWNNESASDFATNLDVFGGNSGSPVFNATTHVVEAILVSGPELEFEKDEERGGCLISAKRPDEEAAKSGSGCTRTTEFAAALRKAVWSEFKPVAGLCGEKNQGADIAVADLNGNGKPDLIAFHIQNPDGENKGFYQIGRDLDDGGNVTGWSEFIQVPGYFGVDTEEAGIAITDLNNNRRPDLVVFHIEKTSGGNCGFYRIGCDLNDKGNVTRGWTQPIAMPGRLGNSTQGAGIAVTDLSGNGKPDLIVFFIDNPEGENKGYYRIGRDLDANGKVTGGWSEFIRVPGWFGSETQGAGIAIEDVSGNGRPDLIVFHLDNPPGGNTGYYRIGRDLDQAGNVAGGWNEIKALPGFFGHESQGAGITTARINDSTPPRMIVYHIDNPAGANKGYYRTGWILP